MPRRSLPWQMVHCTVLPLPPVVTSASPFLMLPGGTYVVNPIRQSRSVVSDRIVRHLDDPLSDRLHSLACPDDRRQHPAALHLRLRNHRGFGDLVALHRQFVLREVGVGFAYFGIGRRHDGGDHAGVRKDVGNRAAARAVLEVGDLCRKYASGRFATFAFSGLPHPSADGSSRTPRPAACVPVPIIGGIAG